MDKKITFHNMEHSDPMESHTYQKLEKIEEILKDPEWTTPKYLDIKLNSQPLHPHHTAELHLKTPQFDLNTHDKGTDMYVVIDNTIDKMVTLLKKEKSKVKDKNQKVETAKTDFGDDKYDL